MKPRRHLSVRAKLFVFLCAVSLLPLILISHLLVGLGGQSFRALSDLQARDGLERTQISLRAAESRLLSGAQAVANWAGLADYFRQPDIFWLQQNLMNWAPESYKLDYLALTTQTGDVLYEWSSIPKAGLQIREQLESAPRRVKSGWAATQQGLYSIARSDVIENGKSLGTLIFARRLTHLFLTEIPKDHGQELMVYFGGRLLATTDTTSRIPYLNPGEIFSQMVQRKDAFLYEVPGANQIIGFQSLQNLAGQEIAALGWSFSQTPARQVQAAVYKIMIYFGVPLIFMILTAALILGLWIERPIRKLSQTMDQISKTGDLTQRVAVTGGGEISSMSRNFNLMLTQLAKQYDELFTFRTMILAMKEGVLIEDSEQRVVYMNPSMEELLGFSLVPGVELRLSGIITTKKQSAIAELGFATTEVEWLRSDGRRIQALQTSGLLENPNGKSIGTLSTFLDVTERNELELELIEASRMAFLGIYSQGIIHNLSGPLNGILGFATLQCRELPDAEIPRRIYQEALRVTDMISDLGRRWQRTGIQEPENVNLNEVIRDELKFLEADLFFKHNVAKRLELDPQIANISGIYGDFSHALLNVIVNAIDALRETPEPQLRIRTLHTSEQVEVEIEDNGCGISAENLSRIFLPFFSTKRRIHREGITSGAGLGLPIARKIMEPYQATFQVRSQIGTGTCITLSVPVSEPTPIAVESNSEALALDYEVEA